MDSSIIAQAYRNNWELYNDVMEGSAPCWDLCILTASNERQAEGYRLQIARRQDSGFLPTQTEFYVLPDIDGVRIGSGGATISALDWIRKKRGSFSGKRILIIHSGGDSKRLPQYSAFGKLFTRVPHRLADGRPSTFFDEFFVALSGLPSRMLDGIVTVSGDVLLVFDHSQLELNRQGVIGVTMKVPADVGTRHGVYVITPEKRVDRLLQKSDIATLDACGAVDSNGDVDIDTGLVWMDPQIGDKLLQMSDSIPGGLANHLADKKTSVSFYLDILTPLTMQAKRTTYLKDSSEGAVNDTLLAIRETVWDYLSGIHMNAQSLRPAEFIHCGSTAELKKIMVNAYSLYSSLQWEKLICSSQAGVPLGTLVNSYVGPTVCTATDTYIEDSLLDGTITIEEGAVVSNVISETGEYIVRRNIVFDQTPIKGSSEQYVSRLYGVYDNPKLSVDNPASTFLNELWDVFFESNRITADDLWQGQKNSERSLWTAKLFPLSSSREESITGTVWLQDIKSIDDLTIAKWRDAQRLSMDDISRLASREELIRSQTLVNHRVLSELLRAKIEMNLNSWEIMDFLGTSVVRSDTLSFLKEHIKTWDNSFARIRGYKCLGDMVDMKGNGIRGNSTILSREFEEAAFTELRNLLNLSQFSLQPSEEPVYREVQVRAAARIDFGGGWSDTPPYSLENGGKVLNGAIKLKGQLPISASASVISSPVFVINSLDQGISRVIQNADELLNFNNPADPLALHKAALVLSGYTSNGRGNRETGIEITTDIDIPKGSGLGTSSIMAGALLQALSILSGNKFTEDDLFNRVLTLEQMLTTGGGWQDQVGGLVPGIKMVTSAPGIPQIPRCVNVDLDDVTIEYFNNGLLLVYTGQRRLAKRLLRNIMGSYISRDPRTVSSLNQIQVLAQQMKKALALRNIDEFGYLLGQHWQVNKVLDPGCTNNFIDELMEFLSPYVCGGKLAGAGGGGFLALIAKSGVNANDINNALIEAYPNSDVRIWPCEISDVGLEIVVN